MNKICKMAFCFLTIVMALSSISKSVNILAFATEVGEYIDLYLPAWLHGWSVECAVAVCVIELLIGVMAVLGYRRMTCVACLALLTFFVWLTGVNVFDPSEYFGSVESCGCFGELIHFLPMASFIKSILLWCMAMALTAMLMRNGGWHESMVELRRMFSDARLPIMLILCTLPSLSSIHVYDKVDEGTYVAIYCALCVITFAGCKAVAMLGEDLHVRKVQTFVVCLTLLAMHSCSDDSAMVDSALQIAGNNRTEMERVLMHFENEGDELKIEAARYMVTNMPFHSSPVGEAVNRYDSAYAVMAAEPKQFRDSVLKALTKDINLTSAKRVSDIQAVKADYLIKAINEAVDTWRRCGWAEDYDKQVFFDYVLPYRTLGEPLSDWRGIVSDICHTKGDSVWSSRGLRFRAADSGTISGGKVVSEPSAQKGKAVLLDNGNAAISFVIDMPTAASKLLRLRYCATDKQAKLRLIINGESAGDYELMPTNNMHTFRDSRCHVPIELKKGENTLTLSHAGAAVLLDYVEMAALEYVDESLLEDYSNHYCTIRNVATGKCVAVDTLSDSLLKPIRLKPLDKSNRAQMLRFDYLGYPCWRIMPADSSDLCLEDRYVSLDRQAPVSIYHYNRSNHQKWVIMPAGGGEVRIMNRDTGMCWEAVEDTASGGHFIVQDLWNGKPSQRWTIAKCERNPLADHFFSLGSAASRALKVTDAMSQFEFIGNAGSISPTIASLCRWRTGVCRDESSYVVALSRALGIPTAIDFTPHWGNRTNSHAWGVLIKPDGKGTPFYMGCVPGDTVQYFHSYLKPKIFRHRFRLNLDMVRDLHGEETVPSLFVNPDFVDVTDEYLTTTDIVRSLPEEYSNHSVAYICVYDKDVWTPVFYGKTEREGNVVFKKMGRNVMYSLAVIEGGKLVMVDSPFFVSANGELHEVKADFKKRGQMTLLRKYPYFGKEDYFNYRMGGGRFQGANRADFSDAVTLFTHDGITEGCWYEHSVADSMSATPYRNVRYLSPGGSYCNINELEFYDTDGKKLMGRILGTEGVERQRKETVFDGDVLTGFHGVSPDGHWVGLQLALPSRIGKIRYMPRNDGNAIERGDVYELKVYTEAGWRRLALLRARTDSLVIKNAPIGGLYLLSDKTKGVEERIFTYENGRQVWW